MNIFGLIGKKLYYTLIKKPFFFIGDAHQLENGRNPRNLEIIIFYKLHISCLNYFVKQFFSEQ